MFSTFVATLFYLLIKLTKLYALQRHVRNEKLTEVSVSYFFLLVIISSYSVSHLRL